MRNLMIFLLFCYVFTGTAKATLSDKECVRIIQKHLDACRLANSACEGDPWCREYRSSCNFELDTKEACEDYEKCIKDSRVEKIKSMGLTAEETGELLAKDGCSYYWFNQGELRRCVYEKKGPEKGRINQLECPGFIISRLDDRSQDYRHECSGREHIYQQRGKICEETKSELLKECQDFKTRGMPLKDSGLIKTLIKDCKFDNETLPPPEKFSEWKKKRGKRD